MQTMPTVVSEHSTAADVGTRCTHLLSMPHDAAYPDDATNHAAEAHATTTISPCQQRTAVITSHTQSASHKLRRPAMAYTSKH